MTNHRSLDEFASTTTEDDSPPDPAELDGLVRTYRWIPDGDTCTGCGQTAQRFWSMDGRMICSDCKEW